MATAKKSVAKARSAKSVDESDDGKAKRYNISIRKRDVSVIEWCDAQDQLSASLRHVIKEYIERYGIDDPTCRPVTKQPRRGRPPGGGYDEDDSSGKLSLDGLRRIRVKQPLTDTDTEVLINDATEAAADAAVLGATSNLLAAMKDTREVASDIDELDDPLPSVGGRFMLDDDDEDENQPLVIEVPKASREVEAESEDALEAESEDALEAESEDDNEDGDDDDPVNSLLGSMR